MILKEDTEGKWFEYDEGVEFELHYTPNALEQMDSLSAFKEMCSGWKGLEYEAEIEEEVDGKIVKKKELKPLPFEDKYIVSFLRSKEGQAAYLWMTIQVKSLHSFIDIEDVKKKLPQRLGLELTTQKPQS